MQASLQVGESDKAKRRLLEKESTLFLAPKVA